MTTPTTTIDALPAVTGVTGAQVLIVQEAGVTKKATVGAVADYLEATLDIEGGGGGAPGPAGPAGPAGPPGPGITVAGTLNGASTPLPTEPEAGDIWILGDDVPTAAPSRGGVKLPGDGVIWSVPIVDGGIDGSDVTIDTGEEYKLIMFSDGTVRAIPITATAPATPTGLARTIRINSVKLTWDATPTATSYRVYRDGSFLGTATSPTYRDGSVIVGATYTYAVQAVNTYSLRSGLTATVSAFIDPTLNAAPTVEVLTYPQGSVPLGHKVIVRVNAFDTDAQLLALTLGTDVGSLVATADPTVWILTPA